MKRKDVSMVALDLYNIYLDMERKDIILSFKGDITKDLLSSVYQIVESRLESTNEDPKRKKKFYYILVECLQNVYHHMDTLYDRHGPASEQAKSAIFMIGRGDNDSYKIITGNFILSENVEALKNKIDAINEMNPAELKAHYLQKLSATELSDKGGAGLGIIDIARKSGNKMDYHFHEVQDNYSFFTLSVTVN